MTVFSRKRTATSVPSFCWWMLLLCVVTVVYAQDDTTTTTLIIAENATTITSTITHGAFSILRDPSSCQAVTLTSSSQNPEDAAADLLDSDENATSCFVLSWAELQLMAAYTTYQPANGEDEEEVQDIQARIGPLFVQNSNAFTVPLEYECPPDLYNGFDYRTSFCQLANDHTLMSVAHTTTGRSILGTPIDFLVGLDVILSGKPFPPPGDLQSNQPPFGAARFTFEVPISMLEEGSLTICFDAEKDMDDLDEEGGCQTINEQETLDLRGLVYSGFGHFSVMGINYTGPSVWIHDDERQLLHLTAGGQANGFWFNDSGFFVTDYLGETPTCTWMENCNFACEVYNYDSRFLDYIGTWNVTDKWTADGSGATTTTTATTNNSTTSSSSNGKIVKVYLGNAIDAAGVFPCLMYMDVDTGYYLGLDKLDTTLGTGGSSFWYSETSAGTPDYESEYPLPTELDCPGTMEDWLTPPVEITVEESGGLDSDAIGSDASSCGNSIVSSLGGTKNYVLFMAVVVLFATRG